MKVNGEEQVAEGGGSAVGGEDEGGLQREKGTSGPCSIFAMDPAAPILRSVPLSAREGTRGKIPVRSLPLKSEEIEKHYRASNQSQ
jgi:hypothetical protein